MKDSCLINPNKEFAIGNSDFITVCSKHCFVDKSLFIKEILNDNSRIILITRPPRFGKTLNMEMLKVFLDYKRENEVLTLFKELSIWDIEQGKYQEDASKYSVIFLTFLNLDCSSGKQFYESMLSYIGGVYEDYFDNEFEKELTDEELSYYDNVINGDIEEEEFYDALYRLTQFLQKVYKREVIILINEYDLPVQDFLYQKGDPETAKIISIMQRFFKTLLQNILALGKVVITGILCLKDNIFKDVSDMSIYNGLEDDPYALYFGLTENEVQDICDKKNIYFTDKLRHYYCGYNIGSHTLYNPCSILDFVKANKREELSKSYKYAISWAEKNKHVHVLMNQQNADIREKLRQSLQCYPSTSDELYSTCIFDACEMSVSLENNETNFWKLLYCYGYLTKRHVTSGIGQIFGHRQQQDRTQTNQNDGFMQSDRGNNSGLHGDDYNCGSWVEGAAKVIANNGAIPVNIVNGSQPDSGESSENRKKDLNLNAQISSTGRRSDRSLSLFMPNMEVASFFSDYFKNYLQGNMLNVKSKELFSDTIEEEETSDEIHRRELDTNERQTVDVGERRGSDTSEERVSDASERRRSDPSVSDADKSKDKNSKKSIEKPESEPEEEERKRTKSRSCCIII